MNDYSLFRHSRLRLALWYAIVMGVILSVSGFGIYRAVMQANWTTMEHEIESIAGTLHDSVEPLLPAAAAPTAILQQIFPDLCLSGKPCNTTPTLIQRHTLGISDRTTYYIRLFDRHGKLLAFSPNQPLVLPNTLDRTPWQTFRTANGIRYHQFTTILHSAKTHHHASEPIAHSSWGYLQIGRTLAPFDAENSRLQWILAIGLPIALLVVAVSSWWLSGLAMQPIYQSYQQQQQFTAYAAHELRSPLASLLATVEATLRLSPSQQHILPMMLQTIERQGRRLSHLIADLLFLTSLEQNSRQQNSGVKPFQRCCLNDLVSDLIEEFSELAAASEINLSCQIPNYILYVLGNESQLYRLVSNLIANAIKYTPAGGEVIVTLASQASMALITVKDTGIGISIDEQTRIFDRFYRVESDSLSAQADASRTETLGERDRKTGGTGLGLAIARAIADRHQGDLTVKSELGIGSLFTIRLPIDRRLNRGENENHYTSEHTFRY